MSFYDQLHTFYYVLVYKTIICLFSFLFSIYSTPKSYGRYRTFILNGVSYLHIILHIIVVYESHLIYHIVQMDYFLATFLIASRL